LRDIVDQDRLRVLRDLLLSYCPVLRSMPLLGSVRSSPPLYESVLYRLEKWLKGIEQKKKRQTLSL